MNPKRNLTGRRVALAVMAVIGSVAGLCGARAQDDRDYMRVIGRPEVLVYAADVATALGKTARRKFPQIEQSSAEGARRTFCTKLRDSPDVMIVPLSIDKSADKLCDYSDPLLALPFGRQVFVLYTAPGAPRIALTREQIFRAVARELPRRGATGAEGGFEPNPNKRWRDISPDLPDLPIRVLGPPRRAVQWLTWEDMLMRPACMALPAVKALAEIDEMAAEQHCLSRRVDQAMVYADGESYMVSPAIVPKGNELVINELRAMKLTPDAVPQPVEGIMPDADSLASGVYPLARPILAVVKVNRLDKIANLRAFVTELVSPAASGPNGYLARDGMDLLPEEMLRASSVRAQFAKPISASGESK